MSNIKDNFGFTLVELMVVIAIISILAVIAGPQYSMFVAKARQSEAKVALGSVFVAESTFAGAEGSYSACLNYLGYDTGMNRYYTVGFHDPDFLAVICGPTGNMPCNQVDWTGGGAPCAPAPGDGVTYFLANQSASSLPPPGNPVLELLPTDAAHDFFITCATGAVSTSVPTAGILYDVWCVNQNKVIYNLNTVL